MRFYYYLLLTIIFLLSYCHAIEYEIVDLNYGNNSEARSINNNNQIVGSSSNDTFLWENGNLLDIGTASIGMTQYVCGSCFINNNGQIAAHASSGADNNSKSVLLYDNGSWQKISSLNTCDEIHGINDQGTIIGRGRIDGEIIACTFSNGLKISLGLDRSSEAKAINNNELIVGWADYGTLHKGFIYDDATVTYFGPTYGNHTYPYGINDQGQIVGTCDGQVFLYENAIMNFPGISGSARDINNRGQIIGTTSTVGYVYDNGNLTLLPCLPGHANSSAYAINDNGWIVGKSAVGDGHTWNAVLWKPIPEPATLLLFGLGGLALRRKQ